MKTNLNTKITEITNTRITTLHPKDTIEKAKAIFDRIKKNILPVVVGNEFRGVLIKQDFQAVNKANKFIVKTGGKMVDISQLRVEDFYKSHEIKVLGTESLILEALEFFVTHRQYYIPVLDNNIFIGLVTPFDVFKYILDAEQHK